MNKSSKSSITASSLVDLKAELFRKQEQLKRDRLQPSGSQGQTSSSLTKQPGSKKPSIWSKKNAGVMARAERDLEQLAEERDKLDDARKKLEAKAKFYEKMTGDGYVPEADTSEKYLVDFEKKVFDQRSEVTAGVQGPLERGATREGEERGDTPPPDNPDEEWVDYTDTLGRSRRCMRKDLPQLVSMDKRLNPQVFAEKEKEAEKEKKEEDLPDLLSSDMYREMLRKKWEEEEEEAAKRPQGPTHYQNIKYDEVRDMGVGYFDFSKDQSERNEQMETLQLLRDETVDQRQRREKLKQKRKAAMQARLEKVKERKRQRGELVEDDEEEEEEGKEKEPVKEERKADSKAEERVQKETTVREWDIGKEPVSQWDQRLSNMRAERPAEFAPPSCYSAGSSERNRAQTKANYPPPKDYSSTYGDSRPKTGHASSFQNVGQSQAQPSSNYPPPKDYTSAYGNSREKTGDKSSNAGFSNWNKPSGSMGRAQPFTAGGVSASSNMRGMGSGDGDDAIASALSYFRQTGGKK